MREINSTPFVNYKFTSKNDNFDYLKNGTACFSSIFQLNGSEFDTDSIIILRNFTTKPSQEYIKKYFEILSKIFKIDITFIDEDSIEVKNFKSLFYLKLFLTLYILLFESNHHYNEKKCIEDFNNKNVEFFKELCNSNFEEFDELQQICISYNNSNIYKNGHCLRSGLDSKLNIISIKELEEFKPDAYQKVQKFFYIKLKTDVI